VEEENAMIVLGIDPSLCNTGLAVVELLPDGERVLKTSVIRTAPSPKQRHILVGDDNARRVAEIARGIDGLIHEFNPTAIVFEAPAGSKGAKAARALALSVATVVTIATLRRLPLVQVQPLDVKRAVCGRKGAGKEDIIVELERRFPDIQWPEPPSVVEHAADAIGAVLACLDSPVLQMARKLDGRRKEPTSAWEDAHRESPIPDKVLE
jgi:Holliday junction resolvasome RuvABC endonuclease subunit